MEPAYWVSYGAFCVRERNFTMALECIKRALVLDSKNRLALFARVAILITMTLGQDILDNIKEPLKFLLTVYPRFSEGHLLAAVYYYRMEILDKTKKSMTLAKWFVNEQVCVKYIIEYVFQQIFLFGKSRLRTITWIFYSLYC